MSVPKGKRSTSELQFLVNAVDLRKEISDLLLRDFGLKDKVRSVEQYARTKKMLEQDETDFLGIVHKYHMPDEDAESILAVVDKYRMEPADRERFIELITAYNMNDLVIAEFPKWMVDHERENLLEITKNIHENLVMANSIYPVCEAEFYERRVNQDRAIGNCYQLLHEMQYIISVFPVNKQKYMRYTDMITREIALIKGWRKSDNKILTRIRKEQKHPRSQVVELLADILAVLKKDAG